jgi:hypothetical protein
VGLGWRKIPAGHIRAQGHGLGYFDEGIKAIVEINAELRCRPLNYSRMKMGVILGPMT